MVCSRIMLSRNWCECCISINVAVWHSDRDCRVPPGAELLDFLGPLGTTGLSHCVASRLGRERANDLHRTDCILCKILTFLSEYS